ncbi:glycosyl hydrolase [Variovorax sp. WS11]|uniref:YCF48-related protein n=1 Tax=Variovorax sp. WS11 TaxID=1105204 RepID=UPI000D0DCC7C|nr:YCF48-related protein [Variovorax sp. WS11]NDZ17742.1 glycosyl hydrolase [Variovorax sp. WS11]PSL80455.1 glycosyl hydrolase [Variovorax sp. WS11]
MRHLACLAMSTPCLVKGLVRGFVAFGWGLAGCVWAAPFADPLDHPAVMRSDISNRPFMAVTQAGTSLVVVGSRGMIALSKDQGQSWQQSRVPVQSDLLAVHFPTPARGWAVGHDGVILHSPDGGNTWTKQLDGRLAAVAFKQYYAQMAQSGDPAVQERAQKALATLEQNFKVGPALPYLDVWFADAQTGYVVGSFGMLATTRDAGKSWQPALDRIDNPDQLNLNAVRGIHGQILIAAERGKVFRYEATQDRYVPVSSDYTGSFFGFVGDPQAVLAFGLRGVVYRSADQGRSWARVSVPGGASIAGGAAHADNTGLVLANAAGQLIVSNPSGTEFRLVPSAQPMRFTGIASLEKQAVLTTGMAGIRIQRMPSALR